MKTSTTPLVSHGAWRARLEKKNRRQGTSAPTLAAAWSGPIELVGALHGLSQFAELVLERVVVEAESQFDEHGGPRNHDAVVHGHLPDGDRVVVCVEAKAGEALGQTVEKYAKAAKHKLENNRPTNAQKRPARLLERYALDYDVADDCVRLMRYQLLSALAGTETEAAAAGADHAVLMIHEFLTDTRHKDRTAVHMADFSRFTSTRLCLRAPWSQRVAVVLRGARPLVHGRPALPRLGRDGSTYDDARVLSSHGSIPHFLPPREAVA